MKAIIKDISDIDFKGDSVAISITLDKSYAQELNTALQAFKSPRKAKPFLLTIEKKKRKRSLNANAYCWQLCQQIAKAVGSSKEIVYKKNIHEVGSFEIMELSINAVNRFIERWQSNGIGWIAEPMGTARKGFMNVIAYYGSSTYDTSEMARLIDAVVIEAKELGIETMTESELESLKASWKG